MTTTQSMMIDVFESLVVVVVDVVDVVVVVMLVVKPVVMTGLYE